VSDPFADSWNKTAKEAIRRQAEAESKALTEATRRRVAESDAKRRLNPNADVGYRAGRKFFELTP
jgi:hypothetical protein